MNLIRIRPENPADAAMIRRIHTAAFGRAAKADLVDALRRAGRLTLSLVAERNSDLAGQIAFSPVTLEPNHGRTGTVRYAPEFDAV